jgi:hypothetical protein
MKRLLAVVASFAALAALIGSQSPSVGAESSATAAVSADGPVGVIGAVGDIACKDPPRNNRRVCRYDDVSKLVSDTGLDAFLVLGDEQYEAGGYRDFLDNYDRSFGQVFDISYPVPGNHEYGTPNAGGYFRYFGDRAFGDKGYYSFDLGTWHLIALNTAICSPYYGQPCGKGNPQYQWLKADLAAHPNGEYACTMAFFHHPRFDWLKYQNASWVGGFDLARAKGFWRLLYRAGADVVLAGHNHNYQRWAPQDPSGAYRPLQGIVQFVVGTGGRNLNGLGSASTRPPNLVAGWAGGFGILRMRLEPGRYDYRFVAARGQPKFHDSRDDVPCH